MFSFLLPCLFGVCLCPSGPPLPFIYFPVSFAVPFLVAIVLIIIMSVIVSPDDVDVAVVPLPDGQHPYGADCKLDRIVQSVFFHYDVDAEVAKFADGVGFRRIKNIRMADPDGSDEQRLVFADSIGSYCDNPLTRATVREAFRRLLRPEPLAAVAALAPPAKRLRSAAASAASTSSSSSSLSPVASAVASSASTSAASSAASSDASPDASSAASSSSSSASAGGDPLVPSSSKTSNRDRDESSSDSASSSDDEGADDNPDKDKDSSRDDSRASRSNDIPTLFDSLGSEVSFAVPYMRCVSCECYFPLLSSPLPLCHALFQSLCRKRKQFLARCKGHIEVDDVPPYHHIVEGLGRLKDAVTPRKFNSKSRQRLIAKRLRTIMEGIYERMKSMAKNGYSGMAQLLYTELSGHGGLGVFRRMDAAVRACERVQVVGGVGGFRRGASVPSRGRGRPSFRGRGGRARDLSDVQCHNCFERGHLRSSCPNPSRGSSKENK